MGTYIFGQLTEDKKPFKTIEINYGYKFFKVAGNYLFLAGKFNSYQYNLLVFVRTISDKGYL